MGFRKLKNDERGSIPVLVALSLTVLLGFSALTVDFGMMASNKQSMQNACDAAALAGAVDLMNGRSGTVTATGYDYAAINGYDHNDDNSAWFQKVRDISGDMNYAIKPKDYKKNPDQYKGSITDVSNVIRVAVAGRTNSPDLWEICHIIGEDAMRKRIESAKN